MAAAGGKTSVVIVTYHTGAVLWACLNSVLQQHHVDAIIIVNNGNPPDIEWELVKWAEKHPIARVISGHGNIGFAKAVNLGAAQAKSDYLMILNPDCVLLSEDACAQLATLADRTPPHMPALVGARLVGLDGHEQRGSRRNLLTPLTALSENIGLWRLNEFRFPRFNLHDEPLPPEPVVVPAISGACMVMRRYCFEKLRGLDESYFLHVEDIDLCRRVLNAGGSVWFHPQVQVLHHLSTSAVSSLFVEWQKTKGFLLYFWRYGASSGRLLQGLMMVLAVARLLLRATLYVTQTIANALYQRLRAWLNQDSEVAA